VGVARERGARDMWRVRQWRVRHAARDAGWVYTRSDSECPEWKLRLIRSERVITCFETQPVCF
jgi:hypothetical protein